MDAVIHFIGLAFLIVFGLGGLAAVSAWAIDKVVTLLRIKKAIIGYYFSRLHEKRERGRPAG